MPERQLVEAVIPLTVTPVLLSSKTPARRNCRTRPGPRMVTPVCAVTLIPSSSGTASTAVVGPPLQPVCESASPVILKPFKSSVMPGAPSAMQGAPLTVQVTSPMSLLLSVIVSVVAMVPLMSVAKALPAQKQTAMRSGANQATVLECVIRAILFPAALECQSLFIKRYTTVISVSPASPSEPPFPSHHPPSHSPRPPPIHLLPPPHPPL